MPFRTTALLLGLAGLLVVVAAAGLTVGAHLIGPATVWDALFHYRGTDDQVTVREIRLSRALLAVGVGAALAVCGALVQVIMRNPLAEPGVLGVTAGAGFAITVGSAAGLVTAPPGELVAAVLGAVAAALVVHAIGGLSPLRLLLTGVALSAVLTGVGLGMRLMAPEVFDRFRFWSVGSFAGRDQVDLSGPLLAILLAVVGAFVVARALAALALGDDVAAALGVPVRTVRAVTLVLVTVLAGAATAVAGPIMFVGLIVPHLARRFAATSVPTLLALCCLLGPILVLLADIGSRVLLPVGEVPVGIVTAFLGGPALIWAARRYGAQVR